MPTNTRSPITKGNAYNASISKMSKIKNPVENIQPAKHITSTNIDSPIKNENIAFIMFVVFYYITNIITFFLISKLFFKNTVLSGLNIIVVSGTSFVGSLFVALR